MPLNCHVYTFETYFSTDIQFRTFEGPLNPKKVLFENMFY